MKKLLFILSVSCLLYSCNKNNYHDLPQDKIPLLNNNDIVYFQDSASSKIDTFQLDVRNIWHQTLEGDYFKYIEIYYNKINSTTPFLAIYFGPSGGEDGLAFNIVNFYSKVAFSSDIKNNLIYQGVTYPTVYILHDYDFNNHYPDTIPNTIDYTESNGIIRYEYEDGRVYNLINK